MSSDPSRLELSAEQMRAIGHRVVDILVRHFAELRAEPVGQKSDASKLRALFSEAPPELPNDTASLFDQLERDVFPNNLHVDHPRFFAFVPAPNNFMSTMADALASGFNVFNGTWLGGSAAAMIELQVIDWFCRWCDLAESACGLFVSGGSVANMTALAAARHAMLDDDVTNAVVYFSDQTHSSVERALRVIGFRAGQLRRIESDEQLRLPLPRLTDAIAQDRQGGLRPFCVVANAGTTNSGAVDPLPDLADLCGREKMWLHVDGAFGAAAVLAERGKRELTGLDRADSISLDPHKWLFQSFECGCVLVRDRALLKSAFQIMPDYLRDVHRATLEFNPCDYGVQLTRSFRALKVWLSINTFGLGAFRDAITRGFELAELAERELRKRGGWEILSPAQMATICFRFGTDDAVQTELMERVLDDGFALLTSTVIKGKVALRLCTINPRTTDDDIVQTIERLDTFARSTSRRDAGN